MEQQIQGRANAAEFRAFLRSDGLSGRHFCNLCSEMEHPPAESAGCCLSLHAGYLCRHRAPAAPQGGPSLSSDRRSSGCSVHFGAATVGSVSSTPAEPVAATGRPRSLGVQPGGACVFFETDRGRLCGVHRELGAECVTGGLPAVPARRPPRRARHADLPFALLPDRGRPARSSGRTRPRSSRRRGTIALEGEVEGLDARGRVAATSAAGDADGFRGLRRVGTAGDRRARTRRPDRRRKRCDLQTAATAAVQTWRPGAASLRASSRPRVRRCVRGKTGRRSGRNRCPRSPGDALGARRASRCRRWSTGFSRGVARTSPRGGASSMARSAATWRRGCSATGSRTMARACTRSSSTCEVCPGRREDGGRAASRFGAVINMADRQRSHSKHRPPARAPVGRKGPGPPAARIDDDIALERFLRYVAINTALDEGSSSCPSTPGQLTLLRHARRRAVGDRARRRERWTSTAT